MAEAAAAIRAWFSFADDAIIVAIVHVQIGWISPEDKRNPALSRFGAGDAAVAVGIPLLPVSAGERWILVTRGLLVLGRRHGLTRPGKSC